MKKLTPLFFIFFSTFIFSQATQDIHFIDSEESKCFSKQYISNTEMRECTIKAAQSWDKELNKYYNLLTAKPQKMLLKY